MSGNKVKGILKGFRYLTQIFENEKEQEIQIGFPTDVEHVAHIGSMRDESSVNLPSWMKEFKTAPGFSSVPLDVQNKGQHSAKWVSEESRRRNTRDLGKASKRQSTGGVSGSPSWEKSNKPRKSSNKPKEESIPTRIPVSMDHPPPTLTVPDIPKKSRRHKPKENSSGRSSKLRSKAQPTSESGSPIQSKPRNKPMPCEENDQDILK
ncbi:hypothetical protein AAZX31_10G036900 [Glycine max]|uniref:CRIB domain-containing protein n=2 Tax=Glycine max TaxID=3847 RepID=I1L8G2_SOYBN|nr:hypothetical protein JHK87_026738 [Glycine soja]KAG4996043.1 hypothetical protein JHK85_027482 [Glycine max]KAH1227494.1 CRIB domain-containing protein RIC1 [Glycine max]KRH32221.1 hypothetical protein GLYMA_10G038900v4 [Glycine max]